MMNFSGKNKWKLLTPTFCVAGFMMLFFLSTSYYPGGSYEDTTQAGYSWKYNYLCNLMGHNALNGMPNSSRVPALASIFLLGFGIGYFFYVFPTFFRMRPFWQSSIRSLGVFSMVFAVLLFTERHDLVLNIAGVMGNLAIIITLAALLKTRYFILFWLGVLSSFLLLYNAFSYYTDILIDWLPLVQKFTIATLLTWIVSMNIAYFLRIEGQHE